MVYSPVYVYNKLYIIVFVVVAGIGSGVVFNLKKAKSKTKTKKNVLQFCFSFMPNEEILLLLQI